MARTRILVTGAMGRLGGALAERIDPERFEVRFTDVLAADARFDGRDFVRTDLTDPAGLAAALDGVEAVVHLGAASDETAWPTLRQSNLDAVHSLYEGVRMARVGRVVFASSFHVSGFYDREARVDVGDALRPDSLYAVTKGFGELMGRYYWDKFGVETVVLRIGACHPEVHYRAMLASWLSLDDFAALIERCMVADRVGYTIAYATSANTERMFASNGAAVLGWHPVDDAEPFRSRFDAAGRADPVDPLVRFKGGIFAARGHDG